MSSYKIFTSYSGSVSDNETGIILNVDIVAQAPPGYSIAQSVLDLAVEKALDYIFDEGFENAND